MSINDKLGQEGIIVLTMTLLNETTYLNKRKKTRLGAVLSNSSFIAQ